MPAPVTNLGFGRRLSEYFKTVIEKRKTINDNNRARRAEEDEVVLAYTANYNEGKIAEQIKVRVGDLAVLIGDGESDLNNLVVCKRIPQYYSGMSIGCESIHDQSMVPTYVALVGGDCFVGNVVDIRSYIPMETLRKEGLTKEMIAGIQSGRVLPLEVPVVQKRRGSKI